MPILEWIGKEKVINHHIDVKYRMLDKIYSFNAHESDNLIIKGDNLEALKSLLPLYQSRVKCIYIDPPYNTGNEGWIYNDNVNDPQIKKWLGEVVGKEGEDLSRHDKWLCMMYPRLRMLQKLLSDDGAILISIDDNEQAYLRMICDEIFGERNFVAQLVWQRTFATKNDAKFFSSEHEYIIVYAKNIENLVIKDLPKNDKQNERYKNPDNDPRGPWISTDLLRMEHRDNSVYGVPTPSGKIYVPEPGTSWRHPQHEMMALIENNEVWFGKDGNSKPRRKRFLSDVKAGICPQTIWKHEDVGHTQEAKQLLKKILDASQDFFATPKPVRLVKQIISIICNEDDIILDSFAGSGTTAQAVLELNREDNGHRKFILVEMMDYAENITAERVKRVIKGYSNGSKEVEGLGGDFTFCQLGKYLLTPDGNINVDVDIEDIRNYIWFTETGCVLTKGEDNKDDYLLGCINDAAYYFYYEKNGTTTLDNEFLRKISTKADEYVIFADKCALSSQQLEKYRITFKKIPRDIVRL